MPTSTAPSASRAGRRRPTRSDGLTGSQASLLAQLREARSDLVVLPEQRFHATRRWRIDLLVGDASGWPGVAVEIQGGIWTGGKHGRGSGLVKDFEKQAAIAAAGYRFVPVTPQDVRTGVARARILACFSRAHLHA